MVLKINVRFITKVEQEGWMCGCLLCDLGYSVILM